MKELAVVFDGSGVVYRTIRIIKDVEKGEVKPIKISGINIADRMERGAMVILRTKPEETIEKEEGSKLLSELLKEKNIPLMVIYKRDKAISDEEVRRTILSDKKVTLRDVQDTISFVRRFKILPAIGTSVIVEVGEGIKYIITSGGDLFPGVYQLFDALKKSNIHIFIASGDRVERTGFAVKFFRLPPDHIFGMMTPEGKRELVRRLKGEYKRVMMVGDDKNDYLAMKEADIAVLCLQEEAERPKEIFDVADFTIKDIREIMEIIEGEKQK
ncbi:MAG: HAD family hydrolase [Candidatus Methanospirareceae archaeon]